MGSIVIRALGAAYPRVVLDYLRCRLMFAFLTRGKWAKHRNTSLLHIEIALECIVLSPGMLATHSAKEALTKKA